MVEYQFDKDQNILFVNNSGRREFESMKEYFMNLKNYSEDTDSLFLLEDARNINVKFSSEHLVRLSNVLSKVAKQYQEVHHAVLLEEKTNVAYAMMINEGISESNYYLKVFSDEQLALEWVKNK